MTYKGPMTRENRNLLQLALAKSPQAERAIDRLYAKTNHLQVSAAEEAEKPPFIVPLLGFRRQGELQLFTQEHFLDLPWRLDQCDAAVIRDRFRIVDHSQSGLIDVSDKGKVEIDFVKRVQGALAPRSVAGGLRAVAAHGVDVVLRVRGGGATTDLAAFDGEVIARAVATLDVPVLTGIGHDIDRSVADEVAHAAYKTPTACAHAVVADVRAVEARTTDVWRAIVATASLELGIDVGYIDLVCQVSTPRSIATLLQRVTATMPLRKVGQPADIANAVVFLASDKLSGHITGQTLTVAGGMEGRLLWG